MNPQTDVGPVTIGANGFLAVLNVEGVLVPQALVAVTVKVNTPEPVLVVDIVVVILDVP